MKGLVLGSVALIALGVSVPAHAAEMAVKAPPPSVLPQAFSHLALIEAAARMIVPELEHF